MSFFAFPTNRQLWLCCLGLLTTLTMVMVPKSIQHHQPITGDAAESDVEIAPYMGNLQRFSQKLGFAVNAENHKLSAFYLQELDEVLGDLKKVEEHDGFPIARSVETIIDPLVADLKGQLEKDNWPSVQTSYIKLIDGCNRCHSALEHEYIQILPAEGQPPYNQKF